VTTRPGQEVTNAELLHRVERVEAELLRITAFLASGGDGGAGAWISYMGRRSAEAAQDRRDLGIDPPLYRTTPPSGRNST
jgi:hypothetical protein